MNSADGKQDDEPPQKPQAECSSALAAVKLKKEAQSKKKGEDREEFSGNKDSYDALHDIITQELDIEIGMCLRMHACIVLFGKVNDDNAEQGESPQDVDDLYARPCKRYLHGTFEFQTTKGPYTLTYFTRSRPSFASFSEASVFKANS